MGAFLREAGAKVLHFWRCDLVVVIQVQFVEPSRFAGFFTGDDSVVVCVEVREHSVEKGVCSTRRNFLEENVSAFFGENGSLIFFEGDGAVLIEIEALEESLVWEFLGGDDAVAVAVRSFEESCGEYVLRGGSDEDCDDGEEERGGAGVKRHGCISGSHRAGVSSG